MILFWIWFTGLIVWGLALGLLEDEVDCSVQILLGVVWPFALAVATGWWLTGFLRRRYEK